MQKGNRPSFIKAGNPDIANELYEYIIDRCRESIATVEKGIFGADMKVSLLNDGPFTILLDSEESVKIAFERRIIGLFLNTTIR